MIKLNKQLFWDTDFSQLNFKKNADFIIGRVLLLGDIGDYQAIKEYYGVEKIKKAAMENRNLNKKSLRFWSNIFNLPISSFRCAKKLSIKKQNAF